MQTYSQLLATCEQYNSLFLENELCLLQKAYSTPHFLTLSLRFPGKTVVLYVGRGNQYQGLYLADKMPPTHLRIQDRLLDYIRKYLVGAKLSKMICEKNKMLVLFEFRVAGEVKHFYFGWSERQLHFGHTAPDAAIGFAIPSEENKGARVWLLDDYLQSKDFNASKKIVVKKKEKFLAKKIENIKKDIEKNSNWRKVEEDLNNGDLDLSQNELVSHGEKVKFQNCKNEWQKRDIVFQKIKKLKRGEEILGLRLCETEKELTAARLGNVEFAITKEAAIQPYWPNQKRTKEIKSTKSNRKNIKLGNINGVVGLDSEGNDEIRKGENKDYYWFHLENHRGAHCILKTDNISQLSPADLAALASMLRDLSHLEILTIPILYTQLKNVKGIKGAQGKVTVNKAKHLQCDYSPWKEIIII